MSVIVGFASQPTNDRSILFGMKAARILAIAFGALVVLYFLVINFIPDWMIVGVHVRWPWSK
jgi:hypothetical protein